MDIQAIILGFEKAPDVKTRETLVSLRRKGYKLAANYACGACDLFFEKGDSLRDAYLQAVKTLGVPPEKCVVVESTCERLLAAKDSGMAAIGVGGAQNCIYADTSIRDFAELADIFV